MAGGGGSHISRSLLILQESEEKKKDPCEPRHRDQNIVQQQKEAIVPHEQTHHQYRYSYLTVTCNNSSACSAAAPVIDALEGLFAGQQYVGQREADIHGALTLSYALLLELLHLLWVSWNHHLRKEGEQIGIWSLTISTGCGNGCFSFVS